MYILNAYLAMHQKYGFIRLGGASEQMEIYKKTDKEEHEGMDNRDVRETKPIEQVTEITTPDMLMDYAQKADTGIDVALREAQLLMDYMEGHGYVLGISDHRLVRGDTCDVSDATTWEEYSLEDAIDVVCEWNYELILDVEAKKNDPDLYGTLVGLEEQLAELKSDEVLLDRLFDQTIFSRELDALAAKLADEVIAIMTENKERLTEAVHDVVKEIHQASGGRSR